MRCCYLLLLQLPSLCSAILLPQLRSSLTNTLHCPSELEVGGWAILKYKAGLSVQPTSEKLGVSVTDNQIVLLKFCQSSNITLPQGSYCFFKGSSRCPGPFTEQTLPYELRKNYGYKSDSLGGALQLCCGDSSRQELVESPIVMPITPPYALLKLGSTCQEIQHTRVSEVRLTNNYEPVLEFCYYEVNTTCSHCQQTCKPAGGVCSCYHGYQLVNNSRCQGVDTCNTNNGGCDHVCNYSNHHVTCSCNDGYSLYDNTLCVATSSYKGFKYESLEVEVLFNNSAAVSLEPDSNPALFSTSRDCTIMMITVVIVVVLTLLLLLLLHKLNYLICTAKCTACPVSCLAAHCTSCTGVVKRASPRRRAQSSSVNRNSISHPHVGNVAVDLLNRPKQNISTMHDLPTSMARVSYYTNTDTCSRQGSRHGNPDSCSLKTESIYDSLDRRKRNHVAISTQNSVQYDEPEPCCMSPLVVPCNDAYYLEPDESAPPDTPPETPLPGYSPGVGQGIYNFSQTYHDPATKFAVGTLGRKSLHQDEGGARVASVAPTLRADSHGVDARETLKSGS